MLEKPTLADEKIVACLQAEYGLAIDQVVFLPVGADLNTAIYRVVTTGGAPYFLKLRRGYFDEISVMLPKLKFGARTAGTPHPAPCKLEPLPPVLLSAATQRTLSHGPEPRVFAGIDR